MYRRSLYIFAAIIGWLVLIGLISAMPVLSGVLTWGRSFRETLTQWFPWMLLSPLIFWFVVRFPLEWATIHWRIFLHLFVGFMSVVIAAWLSSCWLAPHLMSWGPDFRNGPGHMPPFKNPDESQAHAISPGGLPPHDHGPHGPPFWARVSFNVPVYLTLVSLGHTFVYFRRSQQRGRRAMELESQLDRARLQALRMQLQPHFLFNTLNAISTLVQTDPHSAQEMIGSLGQMLRLSLDSGSEVEVPLEQELKFLDSYLEIAQTRFGDRLQVKRDITPVTLNAFVPTFVLQPLVENALKHGIEPGSSTGTIEIRADRVGDRLLLSISDSGVGLANTAELISSNGIGLSNTKSRLESLYPGNHRFSVRNRVEGGCIAELEIPFHTEPQVADGQIKTA